MKLISQKDNEIILLTKHDIRSNDDKKDDKVIKNISKFDIANIKQRLSSIYEVEKGNVEINKKNNNKKYDNTYSLDTIFKFGKYKQMLTLKNVIDDDYSYLQFCLSKDIIQLDDRAKEYVNKRNNKTFEVINKLKKQIEKNVDVQQNLNIGTQYTDFNRDESPDIVEEKFTADEEKIRKVNYDKKIDSIFSIETS